MRDACLLRPADCLEVLDPLYQVWATARVVIIVGDLLLVHFEGYSARWLIWLDRTRDGSSIRPLNRDCPNIGSQGEHTILSWERICALTHARLRTNGGASVWPAPDDEPCHTRWSEWPALYQRASSSVSSSVRALLPSEDVRDADAPLQVSLRLHTAEIEAITRAPTRDFRSVHEYARDRALCRRVYRAAVGAGSSEL